MIAFFKDCSTVGMKRKLVAAYILNVTDIALTLMLKSTGFFVEANPLIAALIENITFAVAVKTLLPAALFIFLYIRLRKANEPQKKISNILIAILFLFYACINLMHVVWFSLYLFVRPALCG